MGTSAGAYAGSLYCAGYSPDDISEMLCSIPPIELLSYNLCFWKGCFILDGVVERLRELLPPTFESLEKPFAAGVVDAEGKHRLIRSGPLPEAIAASGAIPFIFMPIDVPGHFGGPFIDGGYRDRTGLNIWRQEARSKLSNNTPPALVHLISRSILFSGPEDATDNNAYNCFVIRTQKSKHNFFSLGDYRQETLDTFERVLPSIEQAKDRLLPKVFSG